MDSAAAGVKVLTSTVSIAIDVAVQKADRWTMLIPCSPRQAAMAERLPGRSRKARCSVTRSVSGIAEVDISNIEEVAIRRL